MEKMIPLVLFAFSIVFMKKTCFFASIILLSALLESVYKKKEEFSLFLLTFLTSLIMIFDSHRSISFILPIKEVEIVRGKIISFPSYRGNETRGYNITLSSYSDGKGNWVSGQGKLYVISQLGNEDLEDEVVLKGVMMDGYFLSRSSVIVKRSSLGRGRRRFLSIFSRKLKRGECGNLTSLLLTGSTLDGGREIQEKAGEMGLSHLFALSGMHLSFICMIVGIPLEKTLGKREGKAICTMFLFLFIYVNGFRPSLLRAFLLLLLSPFFGVGYGHVLSLLLMIKIVPGLMTDYGAALSFSALSGILLVVEGKKGSEALIASTCGALTATVPFSLHLFSYWSLSSLFLAIPGGIMMEVLFFIVIINIFIPKLDYIIHKIYNLITSLPTICPPLPQYDLKFYWPILFTSLLLIFLNKAFPFIERWIIIKTCGISIMTAQKKSKEY